MGFWDFLFKKLEIEKLGEITNDNLNNLFKEKKSDIINLTPLQIFTLNEKYSLTNVDNIKKFLSKNYVNWRPYTQTYDCEKFALQLWANFKKDYPTFALGFAISSTHAFNFFIDEKKKIWLIEPQTDKVFEYPSESKYKPRMILI